MNNDKHDVNSYVNGSDLERYLAFLRVGDEKLVWRESELVAKGSWDGVFNGFSDVIVILLGDDKPIGHFVALRRDNPSHFTYMDCLGKPLPDSLRNIFEKGQSTQIQFLTRGLMSPRGNICGKYCVAFCLAGNIDIDDFADILTSSRFPPDYLVNNLLRINYSLNVLDLENFPAP